VHDQGSDPHQSQPRYFADASQPQDLLAAQVQDIDKEIGACAPKQPLAQAR
jgi:hypothetical protein